MGGAGVSARKDRISAATAMGQMEEGRGRKGRCTTTQPADMTKHTMGPASQSREQGLVVRQRSAAVRKKLEAKSVIPAVEGVSGSLLDAQGRSELACRRRPCPECPKAR